MQRQIYSGFCTGVVLNHSNRNIGAVTQHAATKY